MSRDNLLPETMFTYYWTAEYCSECFAAESPLILPGKPAATADPHFAVFGELLPTGIPRRWIWLFPNAEQPVHISILGHREDFRFFVDFQDMVQRTIPPKVGRTAKTKLVEIDPLIFTHVPNLEAEIEEVWVGFDRQRLYRDFNPRSTAQHILSVGEFLDRLKRRVI